MSRENVDLVCLAYDLAFAQRSVEGIRDLLAEDYLFHARNEWPGRALYRAEEMPQLWADLDETFSEFNIITDDFAAVGDEWVVVTVRQFGRVQGTAARVESTVFHVWNVRNGKLRETWGYGTREEAFEAVGMRE